MYYEIHLKTNIWPNLLKRDFINFFLTNPSEDNIAEAIQSNPLPKSYTEHVFIKNNGLNYNIIEKFEEKQLQIKTDIVDQLYSAFCNAQIKNNSYKLPRHQFLEEYINEKLKQIQNFKQQYQFFFQQQNKWQRAIYVSDNNLAIDPEIYQIKYFMFGYDLYGIKQSNPNSGNITFHTTFNKNFSRGIGHISIKVYEQGGMKDILVQQVNEFYDNIISISIIRIFNKEQLELSNSILIYTLHYLKQLPGQQLQNIQFPSREFSTITYDQILQKLDTSIFQHQKPKPIFNQQIITKIMKV